MVSLNDVIEKQAIEAAAKRTALVVEDDPVTSAALTRLLKHGGVDTETVGTYAEAVAKLKWGPQYLLLDLALPDGNGLELLRSIRADNLPVKVAVMTGGNAALVAQAEALRPEKLLQKPFDYNELVAWVKEAGAAPLGNDQPTDPPRVIP